MTYIIVLISQVLNLPEIIYFLKENLINNKL